MTQTQNGPDARGNAGAAETAMPAGSVSSVPLQGPEIWASEQLDAHEDALQRACDPAASREALTGPLLQFGHFYGRRYREGGGDAEKLAREVVEVVLGAVDMLDGEPELARGLTDAVRAGLAAPPLIECDARGELVDSVETIRRNTDHRKAAAKARELAIFDEARALNAARRAAKVALTVQTAAEFAKRPSPEYLVEGWIYRDSTFQIVGPPGEGKSFLTLDLLCSAGMGRAWAGGAINGRVRTLYLMAEGGAVNSDRMTTWAAAHGLTPEAMSEWVHFVETSTVRLHPDEIGPVVELVRAGGYGLVVFDTQSRFSAGMDEVHDLPLIVAAMDAVRAAVPGCAVGTVHHTPISDPTRGRGGGAIKGAVETLILVSMDKAKQITATVDRDKNAERGLTRTFRLEPVQGAPSVVLAAVDPLRRTAPDIDPLDAATLPQRVVEYRGRGQAYVIELAKLFQPVGNRESATYTRKDAAVALGLPDDKNKSFRDAWAALRDAFVIETCTGTDSATAEHKASTAW